MKNLGYPVRGKQGSSAEKLLQRIIEGSIKAVKPSELFESQFLISGNKLIAFGEEFDLSRYANVKCVAIGKSAEAMAYEVEKKLNGKVTGIIATPIEKHFDIKRFRFFKTGHPLPDEESVKAGEEVERFVSSSQENELLMFLISGGGSAAVFVPVDGVSLEEANQMVKILLDNGVPINKINLLRRHLSRLGGGKLAALAPKAEKLSLIISDVVGDDLVSIASGHTVQDTTNPIDAYNFLNESSLMSEVPQSILKTLNKAPQSIVKIELGINHIKVIASNNEALRNIERIGIEHGFETFALTRSLEMDAQTTGEFLVSIAHSVELDGMPVHAPALIILGGETTVKLKGEGMGGRNQHLVLCALRKMVQLKENGVHLERTTVFSFGTDGKDGSSDAAGAFASLRTHRKTENNVKELDGYISINDSNSFFKKYGGLISTDNTDTNVMDIMGIIVE
jgi:glycerate-2-kinase